MEIDFKADIIREKIDLDTKLYKNISN